MAAAAAGAQEAEDWKIERLRWEGPAAAVETIRIHNPYGDVRCRPAPGDEMSITAIVQRHERDADVAELQVTPGSALGVEVAWVAGDAEHGGEFVDGMERRRVDLMVLVPAGPTLDIRTASGLLEAKSLANDVRAATARGDVVLAIAGTPTVLTDGGRVDVTLRGTDWSGPARLETATGQITVWLPPATDALVEAATEGILSTDFSIEVNRSAGGRRKSARAVLGEGARRLTLTSVKGDVRLFRLPG